MSHLVRLLMLLLVLCVSSLSDSTQPSNFELGPNGENCIQSSEILKRNYEHNDEKGHHCLCQLCGHGYVLTKHCTCDPNNLEQPQVSECVLVSRGQFMDSPNMCSQGFECKKCPHPLKERNTCSPHGPDAVCTCADGYYMTSPDTCLPVPRCDAGFQPVPGHGDHGTEIRCTRCPEGYFQPNNNSTLRCKRIRQCTVQEGNPWSDAVCLNDPMLQPIKQPTYDNTTTQTSSAAEFTESYKPVTTNTPVPTTGYENTTVPTTGYENTTNGSSTCPTPNNPDKPPTWVLCLIFFVFGISIGFIIHRAYARKGLDAVPKESNQLMSALEEPEVEDGLRL